MFASQSQPEISQGFWVAWRCYRESSPGVFSFDVLARRFDMSGGAQTGEIIVPENLTDAQEFPDISAYATGSFAGGFVATWTGPGSTNMDVLGRRFDVSGTAQTSDIILNQYRDNIQRFSRIAVMPSGDFAVIWEGVVVAGGDTDVAAAKFSAAGVQYPGTEQRINTTLSNDQRLADVAYSVLGRLIYTWTNQTMTVGDEVFYRIYNANMIAQTGETLGHVFQAYDQSHSSVSADNNGNFVISWMGLNPEGPPLGDENCIMRRQFNYLGTPINNELSVHGATTSAESLARVAMATDGRYVIAWSSQSGDTSGESVMARAFNADGTPHGNEFVVNSHTMNSQTQPDVSMLSDDKFVIAWQSYGQDNDGNGVYAKVFWWEAPTPTPTATPTNSPTGTPTRTGTPTITPTPTASPFPATATASPTMTSTWVPTRTPTQTPTASPTPAPLPAAGGPGTIILVGLFTLLIIGRMTGRWRSSEESE